VEAPQRRSIRGPIAWLGAGGGDELAGHVVVVSPHLDDAVLSVGAAMSRAARRGARVEVLTVLAGDPEAADVAPSSWDEAAGFATAAAAAAARRDEDRVACEGLGARPRWLPFWDRDYGPERPEPDVRSEVASNLAAAETVLLPGWPLWHSDHLWVTGLALGAIGEGVRVGVYVEQPYAMWELRPETALPTERAGAWRGLRAGLGDRLAKGRALRAYATQLPLLGQGLRRHLATWEARRGGEHVAWLEAGPSYARTAKRARSRFQP
jgi:LmbE family N-acetylglucosaminyl deacetylase